MKCNNNAWQVMLLWLMLLLKPAVAAKASACCGAYKKRPFCFAKEQRKPTQTPSPLS
jgi:hypothetical protein